MRVILSRARLLFALAFGLALLPAAPLSARATPAAVTYTVDSTADEPAADPASPVCASTPSGRCTLRAAIMRADFAAGPNTIVVPTGTFSLTRPGYDDNALVGDLDIAHDLTIQGAGSSATIVDGNGSVTNDRVFQILSSATNVTITGMTIRNGQSMSSTVGVIGGGGLYLEGAGHLQLSDVIVEGNTGQNGGGIYANFSSSGGSITMDNVSVRANTAIAGGVGAGGGLFAYLPSNLSQAVIRDSKVYSNTADGTGGGLFVDGNNSVQWSVQRSEIYSNTAASGGGIGNFVPLSLSDSRLHNNSVTFDGGAIEAESPLVISRTTFDANSAKRFGGAIFSLQTGGNALYPEFAHIVQSTLSGNSAQYGGGIYHDGFIVKNSLLTLINSTLSGNSVFRPVGATGSADGGGLYVYGGQAQLLNATVAGNRVQLRLPPSYPGIGAGLYITASATFSGQNSLIANNTRGNGIILDAEDDCFSSGTVGTLAYALILTTTNCFVTGPQGGLIIGQDPLLGPLRDNGGATQTHALLPGSPAIDAGAPAGCTDDLGAALTADQRGVARPQDGGTGRGNRCDIGAYEVQVPTQLAFATQPGGAAAGSPLSPQPAVRAEDTSGGLVPDYTGTVTLAIKINPAGGTLGGTTSVPASGGVASFGGLSIDRAGAGYTLIASAAGLSPATSAPFNITVPATSTPTATPTPLATATPTSTATPAGVAPRSFLPFVRR
jgi:CSLREA domain-containing protein